MAEQVLRRKVRVVQPAAAGGAAAGAERAWRLAFARAARDMMGLQVDFLSLTDSRLSLAELLDLPPERALILLLEGPGEGLGLMILSPGAMAAMIEVMTLGRCAPHPPDPRRPTRTDAAMLAPLADLAMEHLEDALHEAEDLVWTGGFRFASFLEEARPLGLLLDDIAYRVLSARISLADGAREGDVLLLLPADGRGERPAVPQPQAQDSDIAFAARLAAQVADAPCQVEGVLARLTLPLTEIMGFMPDMILPLPGARLDRVSLEGGDARRIARGKLGQQSGMRALRLTLIAAQDRAQEPAPFVPIPSLAGAGPAAGGQHGWPMTDDPAQAVDPFAAGYGSLPATGTG